MLSQEIVQLVLIILIATVFTIEYAFILKTWRTPLCGYRILMSTIFVVTVFSEVERVVGDGLLAPMPRSLAIAISVNFVIFEVALGFKRRAQAMKRRIFVEHALVEDSCFEKV